MGNCLEDEQNSNKSKRMKYGRIDESSQEQCVSTPCGTCKNVTINVNPPSNGKKSTPLENDVFVSDYNLLSDEFALKSKIKSYLKVLKIVILVGISIGCSYILMVKNEKVREMHQLSIPANSTLGYLVTNEPKHHHMSVNLEGALLPRHYADLSKNIMKVWVELLVTKEKLDNVSTLETKSMFVQNVSQVWRVPVVSEMSIGVAPTVYLHRNFMLSPFTCGNSTHCFFRINLETNLQTNFPISLSYNLEPINTNVGVIYAAFILIFLYVLIIFELIHKTLAAMIASTLSIAILAALNARPTMAEIISWIDIETLLLLFSMMTLVAIFSETGIFDYLAVLAYRLTNGRIWPLINTLCFFTALLSCFLDNVTTALLMTPVTIRLCEVMRLNPVPVLINMIIYSNIGGAITPIGDPPNVIIASNAAVIKSGINFGVFTVHMGVGVIFTLVVVYFQLRFMYRDVNDLRYSEPNDVQDLRREIAVWRRAAASMGSYSREEHTVKDSLMKRSSRLMSKLNVRTSYKTASIDNYSVNVQDLIDQYPIKDKPLLIKSVVTVFFVICIFFLNSLPEMNRLGLGWTALLGALLLLVMCGRDDIDAIFAKVEWGTLLFFASLFILMEALSRLGLIDWIGSQTQLVIMSVEQESRLTVAILIILWVSACVSAFVDNIPLTTMMIRITIALAENAELQLPLQPLIWALSFGACLGGNGTLFGSSSNIVCAGVAEQHGYKFSFLGFMKVGFPVMISSMCVVTIYLIVVHVVWCWH